MNFSIKKLAQKIKIWDGTNTASINSSNELYTAVNSLGTTISANSNSQLRTTSFDSSGNEGQTIIGANYVSGVSGIDASTETQMIIDYEHHEIHSGSHFNLCDYQSFSNGQIVDFTVITTDTAKWAHLVFSLAGEGALSLDVYRGATVDVAGTAATPINNNENSSNTSSLTIRTGDTFTAIGTKINGFHAGANKSAGFISRQNELVLRQNTTYLFRMTNQTNSVNVISYCAEWYEHTNKN